MAQTCAHDTPPKQSKRAVAAALRRAEARSLEAGARFTPLRKRVFELLVEAGGPVKAYDLIARLKAGETSAPPTVYRALDALVAVGLAHRVASLNAYVACHHEGDQHAAWLMICDCCGNVEEIAQPSPEALKSLRQQSKFQVQALEAHGRCERCSD